MEGIPSYAMRDGGGKFIGSDAAEGMWVTVQAARRADERLVAVLRARLAALEGK